MKPWLRVYREQRDWRSVHDRFMLEIRGGVFGWQFGLLLPRLGFSLWRSDYERVAAYRWHPVR